MYKAFLVLMLAVFSVQSQAREEVACPGHTPSLYQVSTIDALLAGAYDGEVTIGELARHGDFGVGTFDALDGEMLAVDGAFYQIRSDGVVYQAALDVRTPFASVVRFAGCLHLALPGNLTLPQLEEWLDAKLQNRNLFYALRIDGRFDRMKTRAVPAQKKPYPLLAEVAKTQPTFELGDTAGILVGLRSPTLSKGISVPGYHWHFLADNKKAGGHVLEFMLRDGNARIDPISDFEVHLPHAGSFGAIDLGRDRTEELNAVEK